MLKLIDFLAIKGYNCIMTTEIEVFKNTQKLL